MMKIVNAMLIISVALIAVLPVACGQNGDSFEPNSEIGDSSQVNLGQAVSSTIFPAGDVDFYKVYLDSPGILRAKLSDVPKDMKGCIDLYGKNYNWINRKDAEKPGDVVIFKADIANPGWYYLGISDLNGGSYDSEYVFKAAR